MGLREYKLAYGHGTQSVMLPEEHISDVLEGVPTPACDVKKATIDCMRHPIGTKPLQELVKKGDKVCLVVADITRAWNRASEFTIHVVNELNLAGVPDEDIYIVFAQGTHRPHTDEENVTCVGEEVARRIKMYQHISTDKSMLTHMGVTKLGTDVWIDTRVAEADKVILINAVSTHDMAGFGGGRKLILPGVAGFETVQQNHCHALGPTLGSGLNPDAKLLKIEGNPVSDDMQEACDMVGPCFLVHSIINEEGEISSMVGGDPYKAWLEGTKETYRMQKVPMKQQADVTIVSAGGYPKDTNLYQGTKCYTTAEIATKKGGIIITMIEAEDVMEPPAYLGSFKYKNLEDMEKGLRGCFTIPFFVAFENLITAMTHTVYIVTRPENFDILREKTHQIPVATVEEAWELAKKQLAEEGKTDYSINIIPHGSAIVPFLNK
jgi:nickel-dependent lactate racemase